MMFDAAAVSTFCGRVDAFVDRSRGRLQEANALADDIKLNGAAVRKIRIYEHAARLRLPSARHAACI